MGSEVYKIKVDKRDEFLADTMGVALCIKIVMISSDGRHPNFAKEMPNALRLTV
jgi:hypothetical protein